MKKKPRNATVISRLHAVFTVVTFLLSTFIFAQVQEVTGTVKDANGVPLLGVNVIQAGTNNGVSTDFDGNYTIKLEPGSNNLSFSFTGFQTMEITADSADLNITLVEDAQELDEVVIIGYAQVSRDKVLGALSSVKADKITEVTPTNAFEGVQGRLSGVQISSNGGPGAGFDIRVRGTSTFSAGGTGPLYVVDGQQLDNIDNIDPNDIASLEVLKDGATTAIYGTRGANGVVLITTKSGKAGDISVDVSLVQGINTINGSLPVANTRQRLFYEYWRETPARRTRAVYQRDSLNLILRNSHDLQDLITRTGIRNQVNLAVSAGSEKFKSYMNVGFLNEDGIAVNSNFKRINSRFKVDYTPNEKLKISSNFNVSFEQYSGLNENQVFQQLVERIAYFPVIEPDGTFTPEIAGRQNPLAEANLRKLRLRTYRGQSFNSIQYNITPELSIKSTLGINFRLRRNNDFQPLLVLHPTRATNPLGSFRDRMDYNIQQENFLNYNNQFGKHSVAAFGGMQILKRSAENFGISNALFVSEAIETFNNVDPEGIGINTDQTFNTRSSLFSTFAGFNYDFDNKYLVSATVRRDGSSRFGDNRKFGYFPSGSLGWRVSNEPFLKGNTIVNNLLIRASYGETGNDRVGDYEFSTTLQPGAIYNGISGVEPNRLGNTNLGWESTNQTNIGIDLGLLKNRITFNIDAWRKITEDLLANVPLPEESGYASIRKNVGGVRNQGIDISISGTPIRKKNFKWNTNFNITFQENEVTRLAGGTSFQSGNYLIEEGQPIGNIYGYKNLGVYQYNESNAYNDEGVRLTPNFDDGGAFTNYTLNGQEYTGTVNRMRVNGRTVEGGDIIWDDVTGDFSITASDRQVVGNGLPTAFGGFNNDFTYKDFTLSFLFDFTLGNETWRRWDEARNDLNSSNETPGPYRIEGAWMDPGDDTVYPRLTRVPQNRLRPNSFFITDGSFIKLRFVRLGYKIPKSILDNIGGIKKCSLFISGNNLLTWTNYPGFNPELGTRGNPLQPGVDNLRYPNDREVILSMNLKF